MTATAYTFFRDGSKGAAKIYSGNLHEENPHQPVNYRIKLNKKTYELYDELQQQKGMYGPILKGNYTNSSKSKATMEGFNMEVNMKQGGFLLSDKWTFTDPFQGNKSFTWKIDFMGDSWKLKDDQTQQVIASFERAGFSFRKQGVLTIYYQVPLYLLAYIILSHKLLHQSLKKEEEKALGEGAESFGG
ncbi:unnamed protein product [Cunninghamella echinulata]